MAKSQRKQKQAAKKKEKNTFLDAKGMKDIEDKEKDQNEDDIANVKFN